MTHVALIATGGTIASTRSEDGASVGVSVEGFNLGDDVDVKRFDALSEGSYRLSFDNLCTIANVVRRALDDSECLGAVVTHGTDTMEETAFFLDRVVDSEKPVVMTGAQRTFDSPDADGPRNLQDSVSVAASPAARGLGTVVCFAGNVWAARGVRKSHTLQLHGFTGTKIGEVFEDHFSVVSFPRPSGNSEFDGDRFARSEIPIVTWAIGTSATAFDAVAATKPSAIMLMGTGAGNAGAGFAEAVARATEAGIPVLLSTRVTEGPVVSIYGNGGGVDLVKAGAISVGDLSVFQARILAAIVASKSTDLEDFRDQFVSVRDRQL